MTHLMQLDEQGHGSWRVICQCGWTSEAMGLGNAWATMHRGLDDKGHAAYARDSGKRTA